MNSRKTASISLLGILAMILATFGAFAELGDLPLGHSAITETAPGKLKVEARCASTEQLLTELAQRMGEPLAFDRPVRNCVSVWMPWMEASPGYWLERVALLAGLRTYRLDGSWHVASATEQRLYDPSLTEEGVRAAISLPPTAQGKSGGLAGKRVVIASGRWIKGPFNVERKPQDDGTTVVAINGVKVAVAGRPGSASPTKADTPAPVPESVQFTDEYELKRYLAKTFYPTCVRSQGKAQTLRQVEAFLRTQPLVEEVIELEPLQVRLRNTNYVTFLLPPDFDYEKGVIDTRLQLPHTASLSPEAQADTEVRKWQEQLKKEGVLIVGRGGSCMDIRGKNEQMRFVAVLEAAEKATLAQRECLFDEIVQDRAAARDMAVGLATDAPHLAAAIRGSMAVDMRMPQ